MALGSGTLTVIGTTVVAALAVGVAIGAHELVGTTNANPSASPSVEASGGDDFCGLMGQLMALGIDGEGPFADVSSSTSADGTDEAAQLDAAHADGERVIRDSPKVTALEARAAKIVSDPAVATAFGDSAKVFDFIGSVLGPIERDAVSIEAMGTAFMNSFGADTLPMLLAGEAANATITEYVLGKCGIDLGGSSDASTGTSGTWGEEVDPATAARTDAKAIGDELTAMFADWKAGDPLPTVDYADGWYTVDNGLGRQSGFSPASSDAAIADEFINGPTDWCVSVEVTGSPSATYNYSAVSGLLEGTCA